MNRTVLPSARGLLLFVLLPVSMILCFYLLAGQPAVYAEVHDPDAPGSISGTIRNSAGEPLAGVEVSLYQSYYYGWNTIRQVTTDAAGNYRFSILGIGVYRIGTRDKAGLYGRNFYPNAERIETATDLVISGNQRTAIDLTLVPAAQITGSVRNADGANPLYNTVELYQKFNRPLYSGQLTDGWQQIENQTLALGTEAFQFKGLAADQYRVCAMAYNNTNSWRECYDNVYDLTAAANLTVTAGATISNVAIVLGDGADYGTISGKLSSTTDEPLAGVSVYVIPAAYREWYPYAAAGQSTGQPTGAAMAAETSPPFGMTSMYTTTKSDGTYMVKNLAAGTYLLLFFDQQGRYRYEYYNNVTYRSNATTVNVAKQENVTGIDSQLSAGAHIRGVVTILNQPAPQGTLALYRREGSYWRAVATTQNDPNTGSYELGGLPAGVYRLQASVWLSTPNNQYTYNSFYGGSSLETATDITLADGGLLANIDLNLEGNRQFAGVLHGRVTAQGAPLANVKVSLYTDNSCCTPLALGAGESYAITDQEGRYTFEGLTHGAYKIRYDDQSGQRASLFYPDQLSPMAGSIVYTGDTTVVNDANVDLPQGGSITGRVYLRNGKAVPNLSLLATTNLPTYGPFIYREVQTAADGSYTLQGLHPGTYYLCAGGRYPYDLSNLECYGYTQEYAWVTSGQPITVTAGETVAGIDLLWGPDHKQYLPVVAR